uniref:Uncharacterized protein n=1 Tax=Lotharella vacuolata TaxID=74820 RepID=A0A0H5BHE4_9EUKA|nr:hypothetical protein [Lotharella vacuolata]
MKSIYKLKNFSNLIYSFKNYENYYKWKNNKIMFFYCLNCVYDAICFKKTLKNFEKKHLSEYNRFLNEYDIFFIFYLLFQNINFFLTVFSFINLKNFSKYYIIVDSIKNKYIICHELGTFFQIKKKKKIYNFNNTKYEIYSYKKKRIVIFDNKIEVYFENIFFSNKKLVNTLLTDNGNNQNFLNYKIILSEIFFLNSFMKMRQIINEHSIVFFFKFFGESFFNFFIILKLKTFNFFFLEEYFFLAIKYTHMHTLDKKKIYLKNTISKKHTKCHKNQFLIRKKLRSRTIFLKKKLFYNTLYLKKKRILFTKNAKILIFLNKLKKKKKNLKPKLIFKKFSLIQYLKMVKSFSNIYNKIQKKYLKLLMICINIYSNFKYSLIIVVRILIYLLEHIFKKKYIPIFIILSKVKKFYNYLFFLRKRNYIFINYTVFQYFFNIEKNIGFLEKKNINFSENNYIFTSFFFKMYSENKKNIFIKIKNIHEKNKKFKIDFNKKMLKKKIIFNKIIDIYKNTLFNNDSFFFQIYCLIYFRESAFFLKNFYCIKFKTNNNFKI